MSLHPNLNITPEELADKYFVFDKKLIQEMFAQRYAEGAIVTSANVVTLFEHLMDSIGHKYFVMDLEDPLVATVIVAYCKLLNVEENARRKLASGKPIRKINGGNTTKS